MSDRDFAVVQDNGCGIADCENILQVKVTQTCCATVLLISCFDVCHCQCFVSTKQANATSSMTTGKFGVGLTGTPETSNADLNHGC